MSWSVPIRRKQSRARNACIASASRSTARSRSRLEGCTTARVAVGSVTIVHGLAEGCDEGSLFSAEVRRMAPGVDRIHAGRRVCSVTSAGHRRFRPDRRGDRIMVGVSGGKDSHTRSSCFASSSAAAGAGRGARGHARPGAPRLPRPAAGRPLRRARTFPFGCCARHLLRGSGTDAPRKDDVHRLLAPPPGHPLQRGGGPWLQQIALGHHREDAAETLLLNLFFAGTLRGMPPILRSDHGRNTVIRPLIYAPEAGDRRVRRGQALPHHPLRPVRHSGAAAAQADEAPARRG